MSRETEERLDTDVVVIGAGIAGPVATRGRRRVTGAIARRVGTVRVEALTLRDRGAGSRAADPWIPVRSGQLIAAS